MAVEISTVTGPGGATPQPPNVSLPRPHSQRESDLIGPPLWAQFVLSGSPSARIWVYSPQGGSEEWVGQALCLLPSTFLQDFSKAPQVVLTVQPGDMI